MLMATTAISELPRPMISLGFSLRVWAAGRFEGTGSKLTALAGRAAAGRAVTGDTLGSPTPKEPEAAGEDGGGAGFV